MAEYLSFNYECILGFKLSTSRNGALIIRGLSHDYSQSIEEGGALKLVDKVMFPGGFYKADIYYQGVFVKTTTFFPAEWTREQVMDAVIEAYDDFIASHFVPDFWDKDSAVITGRTKNGLVINMFVTRDSVMQLAYPILL